MTPAVFLDRDGTLIEESRVSRSPRSARDLSVQRRRGPPAQPRRLRGRRHLQPVRHRPRAGARVVRRRGARPHRRDLQAGGASLDAFYYCPHHPDATVAAFRQRCECRKPAAGMLTAAAAEHGLDLARSFVVGDRWDDVGAARAARGEGRAGADRLRPRGRSGTEAGPHRGPCGRQSRRCSSMDSGAAVTLFGGSKGSGVRRVRFEGSTGSMVLGGMSGSGHGIRTLRTLEPNRSNPSNCRTRRTLHRPRFRVGRHGPVRPRRWSKAADAESRQASV